MMDKNEFDFRCRFAVVMHACIMMGTFLLEAFLGCRPCRWWWDLVFDEQLFPLFFFAPAVFLWIIAPYFRDYFEDFKSSGYTPLIEKNDLYFRILFIGAMFVCFLLCLLLLDKFAGTSLMVWLLDNLWIFGVIAGSSWVISPYLRNYFNIFQDSDK